MYKENDLIKSTKRINDNVPENTDGTIVMVLDEKNELDYLYEFYMQANNRLENSLDLSHIELNIQEKVITPEYVESESNANPRSYDVKEDFIDEMKEDIEEFINLLNTLEKISKNSKEEIGQDELKEMLFKLHLVLLNLKNDFTDIHVFNNMLFQKL